MREAKPSKVGLDYEEHPESPYDVLHVRLPMPRLMWLPKETRDHLRAARREQLLAVRSLIDAAIRRLEEGPARKSPRPSEEAEIH